MEYQWTDINWIAESLYDTHPDVDPLSLRFTELREKILALPEFSGAPDRCNEKILEAIQMAWLDETN